MRQGLFKLGVVFIYSSFVYQKCLEKITFMFTNSGKQNTKLSVNKINFCVLERVYTYFFNKIPYYISLNE